MRSVVVDSPIEVVQALLSLVAADQPRQFVDYGCGRGEVLLQVARCFPHLPCVGVDIDDKALGLAQRRVREASIKNVRLSQGDVLDHVCLAEDLAYLYLGGALNQRLGHELLARGMCRRILAVRYPIIGAISTASFTTDDSSIYIYDRATAHTLVEWDVLATAIELPRGAAYLLSRAIRVTVAGDLSLQYRMWNQGSGATIRSFEFGLSPARPGVPTICDVLIEYGTSGAESDLTIFELSVVAEGVTLAPSHVVVVTPASVSRPTEQLLYTETDLETLLASRPHPIADDR